MDAFAVNPPKLDNLYDMISGDEDARVCKEIPEAACNDQPRNFFAYLLANLMTKIGDELSSAKLILPWLLAVVGAPTAFTGFVVPIREAFVLLPQMVVAAYIRAQSIRKGVWQIGAFLSGIALLLMAATALGVEGTLAGWAILACLVLFSLARGLCSVAAKDVLGKTVSKSRRGRLMGLSAGIAGGGTLVLGLVLSLYTDATASSILFVVLFAAGALLFIAAVPVFGAIREQPGATSGGGNALEEALKSLSLLWRDRDFGQFVAVRTLLLAVALAPPFYVILAQRASEGNLSGLGLMIIASGIASSLSAPIWGWLGDRSSRWVMVLAAILAGVIGLATWLVANSGFTPVGPAWTYAFLFLMLGIAHSGVRLGRKIYLVDLGTSDNRAAFVAVSNTVIGVAMLAAGFIGILGDLFGPALVVLILALSSFVAAVAAYRLKEVSDPS